MRPCRNREGPETQGDSIAGAREPTPREPGPKLDAVLSTVDAGKFRAYSPHINKHLAGLYLIQNTLVDYQFVVYTMPLLRGSIASVSAYVAALLLVCLVHYAGARLTTAAQRKLLRSSRYVPAAAVASGWGSGIPPGSNVWLTLDR